MHYYFHIRAEGTLIPDDEGMTLRDIHAARAELRASAWDLFSANSRAGRDSKGTILQVEDEGGMIVEMMAIQGALH